ncbi:MAG: DUF928 domain-containing protein [Candidatus Scalindua sp.]|nr:DUF928 domain-containing protein [Candidatus Scalindua sp.]
MKYDNTKRINSTIWVLIAGLMLLMPLSGFGAEVQRGKKVQQNSDVQNSKRKPMNQNSLVQRKETAIVVDMPVYKPPKRGAPAALVGGGSRGTEAGLSPLSVIAPDHVGLTVREQPSLYWYLSKPVSSRIEFTLIDNIAIQPLLELELGTHIKPGMHRISLADYGIYLSTGKQYQWFVALVADPEHRSKDVIAGGVIEYIEPPESLTTRLAQAGKAKSPHIYAESGIWYDAFSSMSDLVSNAPEDMKRRKQRASLIEQVGLSEVSEYAMNR